MTTEIRQSNIEARFVGAVQLVSEFTSKLSYHSLQLETNARSGEPAQIRASMVEDFNRLLAISKLLESTAANQTVKANPFADLRSGNADLARFRFVDFDSLAREQMPSTVRNVWHSWPASGGAEKTGAKSAQAGVSTISAAHAGGLSKQLLPQLPTAMTDLPARLADGIALYLRQIQAQMLASGMPTTSAANLAVTQNPQQATRAIAAMTKGQISGEALSQALGIALIDLHDLTNARRVALVNSVRLSIGAMVLMIIVIAFFVFAPMDRSHRRQTKDLEQRNRALDEARVKAESANKMKSQFLANMSHEIRTPMTGVVGVAELLSASELTARQKSLLDVVVRSGKAMVGIINHILDFSKIEAGKVTLAREPFDVVEVVEDVVSLLGPQARRKGIDLVLDPPGNARTGVIGDRDRYRQVVMTLVGNAIKFTANGRVLINVEVAEEISVAKATVFVSDTGPGVKESEQEQIFESFGQAATGARGTREGTGLGLSISSVLARMMG
ncbi:MAG: histidine kinase dimerization/phospho-acceptor domain-containing protein, partial [Quisquiliibacterium sp.]